MNQINTSKSVHNLEKSGKKKGASKAIKIVDPPKKEKKEKKSEDINIEIEHISLDTLKI